MPRPYQGAAFSRRRHADGRCRWSIGAHSRRRCGDGSTGRGMPRPYGVRLPLLSRSCGPCGFPCYRTGPLGGVRRRCRLPPSAPTGRQTVAHRRKPWVPEHQKQRVAKPRSGERSMCRAPGPPCRRDDTGEACLAPAKAQRLAVGGTPTEAPGGGPLTCRVIQWAEKLQRGPPVFVPLPRQTEQPHTSPPSS